MPAAEPEPEEEEEEEDSAEEIFTNYIKLFYKLGETKTSENKEIALDILKLVDKLQPTKEPPSEKYIEFIKYLLISEWGSDPNILARVRGGKAAVTMMVMKLENNSAPIKQLQASLEAKHKELEALTTEKVGGSTRRNKTRRK